MFGEFVLGKRRQIIFERGRSRARLGQRSCADKCVPKWSLGTRGREKQKIIFERGRSRARLGQRSCADNCVPKWSLGTRGRGKQKIIFERGRSRARWGQRSCADKCVPKLLRRASLGTRRPKEGRTMSESRLPRGIHEIPPATEQPTGADESVPPTEDHLKTRKDLNNQLKQLPGDIVDLLRKTGALRV